MGRRLWRLGSRYRAWLPLFVAACTEPGDDVLTEAPGYELIDTTLKFLGLNVRYYQRRFEDGYQIDVEEIERNLTPKTRLIVVTNLHNPTGVLTDDETLRRVSDNLSQTILNAIG